MRPLLLVTIDVEEDMPGWEITDPVRVENLRALPRFHAMCAELGVRPTYLCTYPVVTDERAAAILRGLDGCELGTHLHAWNTPPFQGVPGRDGVDERTVTYFQFELGAERLRPKLESLHAAVTAVTGEPPVSFRAGRFGIDETTLRMLPELGYLADTSVTPLENHRARNGGPDFRRAPRGPYRPDGRDLNRPGDLPILEIPVSVSFTRRLSKLAEKALVYLPRGLRVRGLLSHSYLGLVDFAWLYPPRFDDALMKQTASILAAQGLPVLNVFLHSSELVPGASERSCTDEDVEEVFRRTRAILEHCTGRLGARPATMREAAAELRPRVGL